MTAQRRACCTLWLEAAGLTARPGAQVVRRWEYGLLSDTSSVIYVQVPADIQGGRFRFWDPRQHDWSIIHRTRVPPATREIDTEARRRSAVAPQVLCLRRFVMFSKCIESKAPGFCVSQALCLQIW